MRLNAGKIQRAVDVARWRLCVGCGACVFACEHHNIRMVDVLSMGLRPFMDEAHCLACGRCLEICPGWKVGDEVESQPSVRSSRLERHWGTVMEVWEGHAVHDQVRFAGSSGGAATAIAMYCLEKGLAGGVLHTAQSPIEPWRNETVLSRSREQLIARTGSRYSPASPCDGLDRLETAEAPGVFIGKPCDIQGLRKAQSLDNRLKNRVAVAIGLFCAGTPSTAGVLELLHRLKIPLSSIGSLRFRGNGWPGTFSVRGKAGDNSDADVSYSESWGFLQAYRPFRCYLCPDLTSESADLSCGDPWHHKPSSEDKGRSLVVVRTERGRRILEGAIRSGYLDLEKIDPAVLDLAQKNLIGKRKAIWGRLATMKTFGLPAPSYTGFALIENWLELPLGEKIRSIAGTARRILQRKYHRSLPYPWK